MTPSSYGPQVGMAPQAVMDVSQRSVKKEVMDVSQRSVKKAVMDVSQRSVKKAVMDVSQCSVKKSSYGRIPALSKTRDFGARPG